jgi:hypothetical protein
LIGRIIVTSAVIGTCGYMLHRYQRRKWWEGVHSQQRTAEHARELEECISGVWSEPRPLIADVQEGLDGPGETAAHSTNGRMVELPLTPQAQRNAWSIGTYLASEGRTENRESAIRTMLRQVVAPGCNWDQGWQPYKEDRRFRDVYEAVGAMLDLAELSSKYAPRSSTEGPGAMICPGWVHESPAPTAAVRTGDYVEILVDVFSGDPDEDTRFTEWAWVRVESVPKDGDVIGGTVTIEAPPGGQANVLAHSERHGFAPGTRVVVPRRCVFRVIQGK